MKQLISTNPARNYEQVGSVPISTLSEIKQKVAMAQKAKTLWKELGVAKRIELIKPLLSEFMSKKAELALLITKEIGKPITESLDDIAWDEGYFKWFLENGEKYLAAEKTFEDDKSVHKIVYEPIGVAAVITPWNFPFDTFLWAVIPNLIAGNTVVFKHSEECPLTGKFIEEVMNKSQLPKGVFAEVYGDGKVGEQLANQDVNLIWFTGSTKVGKKLYEIAGRKFIKTVLEMGGSNPAIVFADVNVEEIISKIYIRRFLNCGQVCDAVKRLIVHESIFDKIVKELKALIETKIVNDPQNKNTDIGSLAAKRQLDLLESQVEDAIRKGAKIITGGRRPRDLKGAYYLPTILTNVKKNMRVWAEETFGPVLVIVPFKTEQEAIELANDTSYGLGAQIYCKDKNRALKMISKIDAGAIDINQGNHWLPCNPFGGYKNSGMGREHGEHGFRELTQLKIIALEK
ncbi:MAG: aldehyde dehydrogenase [Candidatus Levybacteria bacterium]|nr:aldehyde dehydrogenase [Candidatus Levybacteria bacterium]